MFTNGLHAQKNMEKRKEKMEALKVAFITEELDLSQEEWQIFWPIYNEFKNGKTHKKIDALKLSYENEPDSADEILDELIKIESEEIAHRHAYMYKLKEHLGAEIVLKLEHLEHKFKHRILRKYKDRGSKKGI
jgi:hypothetical protein